MKRISVSILAILALALLVSAYSRAMQSGAVKNVPMTAQTIASQTATPAQRFTIEKQVSTQQRINRYFHGSVVPKLKSCWSNIQGKGTITFRYTYTKAGASWTFNRLETDQSSLSGDQNAVALKCMSDAVRGTSFPADTTENIGTTFVLNWKWPVPFPANAAQLTTAMFAARLSQSTDSGSDCDGNGTAAKCYTCDLNNNCKKVCVGYKDCKLTAGTKADCTASGFCASGGPFGVSGSRLVLQ